MVLCDLSWSYEICEGYAWFVMVQGGQSWVCLIRDVSEWSELVREICDGSAWSGLIRARSVILLCNLRSFWVIWVVSAWSVMVLHCLSWFWMICYGSVRSELVLDYLWWLCLIYASYAWSELVLRYLSMFCMMCDGSMWSKLVRRDLWWYCMICDSSACSVMVLCDLCEFRMIFDKPMWSELVLRNLWWFCVIWVGSARSVMVLSDRIVKVDENVEGEVPMVVRPIVLELGQNSLPEWCPGKSNMVLAKFSRCFRKVVFSAFFSFRPFIFVAKYPLPPKNSGASQTRFLTFFPPENMLFSKKIFNEKLSETLFFMKNSIIHFCYPVPRSFEKWSFTPRPSIKKTFSRFSRKNCFFQKICLTNDAFFP